MEIFGDFVPTALLVCTSLALLYVFVTPLLILLTFRYQALPNIVQLHPDTPFPEVVREYLFECHEELTSLGFDNVGTFSLPNQMPNAKAVFALFANRERKTSAMAALMYAKVLGDWKLSTKYMEFSTRFSGGGLVDTMNTAQVGAFPEPPDCIKTQHPEITDIGVLHSAHQLLGDTHFFGRARILRLYDQFHGDAQAFLAVSLTEELEAARAAGYLRLVGGDQAEFGEAMADDNPYRVGILFTPPSYRATLKGAYLMAWKELWPFKPIVYRLKYRRDRKRLLSVGFVPLKDHAPVSR
jgi:hypothetical protein